MYKEYDPKDYSTWNSSIGLLCDGDEFEVVMLYRPDLKDGKLVIIKDKLDRKEVDEHFFIALSRMFWDIEILYSCLEAHNHNFFWFYLVIIWEVPNVAT